jgi:Glycosyl transferase family 2
MATVRVFLLTYRRPHLLRRALRSLLDQTFQDWVCELHNDDPSDSEPGRVLAQHHDPRITLVQHTQNLGPVASFNLAYLGGPEPYTSLLEDDNWWDPEFLASALKVLRDRPGSNLVWSNMRIWTEEKDGTWRDTGQTIWSGKWETAPITFAWPQPIQFADAIHSHGAMVVRTSASAAAIVPPHTPVAIVEHLRERLIAGELTLIPTPLANFALTQQSARSRDRVQWAQAQAVIAASFMVAVKPTEKDLEEIWTRLRNARPPSTQVLFNVAFGGLGLGHIVKYATARDWMRFILGCVRHPGTFLRARGFERELQSVWESALQGAMRHSAESRRDFCPAVRCHKKKIR